MGIALKGGMGKRCFLGIILVLSWGRPCLCDEERPYGYRSGYVQDIDKEYAELIEEVQPVEDPTPKGININKLLFNDRLRGEFKWRYKVMFGQTEVEEMVTTPNRHQEIEYGPQIRLTTEQDRLRREEYADFVVKRLSEYHVDQYLQKSESMRPVYEAKEKFSNLNIKTKAGYSYEVNYLLSVNTLTLKFKNPFEIDVRAEWIMDKEDFGPSKVQEQQISMSYRLNPRSVVSSHYKMIDGTVVVVGHRNISRDFSGSITASTYVEPEGISVREKRVIFGLGWVM